MTLWKLLLRNLRHFWRADLATLAGMAVATAVLVGALLVGDSVRGSLQELAVARLGPVDYALVSPLPFDASLADRLAASELPYRTRASENPRFAEQFDKAVAGLIVKGGAATSGRGEGSTPSSETLASSSETLAFSQPLEVPPPPAVGDVQIIALSDWQKVGPGECVLNGRLADDLGVRVGGAAEVDLNFPKGSALPLDASLARRGRNDVLGYIRKLRVGRIDRAGGMTDLFSLTPSQRPPRNAWVNLEQLQEALGEPRKANVILVSRKAEVVQQSGKGWFADTWERIGKIESSAARTARETAAMATLLQSGITLEDYGVSLVYVEPLKFPRTSYPAVHHWSGMYSMPENLPAEAILESRYTYLPPAIVAAAERAAGKLKIPIREVTVNLAVRVQTPATQPVRAIHYAIVAGVSDLPDGNGGAGRPIPDGHAVLNLWSATQLADETGKPPQRMRFSFFRREADGKVRETWNDDGLTVDVSRTLPMSGIGADPWLTPSFAGLTDQARIADWRSPTDITIDRKLITKADEDYWAKYRAAPKLFVNLPTARRLWGDQPGGFLTSIRVTVSGTQPDAFKGELLRQINPADLGLVFRPVRQEQLAAAGGTTDFAQLFVGFSFFLIAAAVLLVALLFRLGIERRARQIGLLGAIGFDRRRVLALLAGEAAVLAAVGAVLGTVGGIGYCWLMMAGLRTWWVGAVGTTALRLFVTPASLAIGLTAGLIVALLAALWGVWRVGRTPAATLLAGGSTSQAQNTRPSSLGLRHFMAPAATALAAIALFVLPSAHVIREDYGFLAGGAMLLAAAVLLLAGRWRATRVRSHHLIGPAPLARLGARNAARHPGRSVLAVALLACASFVLVIVGANRQGGAEDLEKRTGGFGLIVTADVPLTGDLNTPAGRKQVGIVTAADPLWGRAKFVPLRRHAGQDVSCLNMTQARSPTVLGVPQAMIAAGGFEFDSSLDKAGNAWKLLNIPTDSADYTDSKNSNPYIKNSIQSAKSAESVGNFSAIPMIADATTAEYSLHLGLGQTMTVADEFGRSVALRLVATLKDSIFQGEVLISEANFRRLFPGQGGYGTVLVRGPAGELPDLRDRLNADLADLAVTVDRSADRLTAFAQVENTYLATFQSLGALGLLLGTVGLAVVLIRSLVERRGELALLAAIGFSPRRRLLLVLAENAWLLVLGIAIGTGSALLGVLPGIATGRHPLNVSSLMLTLGGITAFGLAALAAAAVLAGRRFTPGDLRAE